MRDDTISLHKEIARQELIIEWLAKAAANGGWHGMRVSPAFMREKAEKAARDSEYMTEERVFQAFRTEDEIQKVENWALLVETVGSRYEFKTYEEGILATLEWLRGETDLSPDEYE